ncbi:MAG TPA: ferritin-like domain-containing protein [Candidatus Acidoferrales bacterium]|nr:ferritin-like domain-containing protein [Candidatus Acidoferrales bacterium]
MSRVSRATLLGASSAIALVGPALMAQFLVAAEAADEGDIKILNVAIALERAGIKAYQDAAGTGLLQPPVLAVASGFMKDHTAHRDALIAAVQHAGGKPGTETTKLTYPELKTQNDILKFALAVERQAAATYLSVIPSFKDRTLAQASGSILGVETTHVAVLTQTLGMGTEPYGGGFVTG